MNINTVQKRECIGCHVCKSVCKFNAITMQKDDAGFLYPAIDEKQCINCGACTNHCPVLKKDTHQNIISAYYGYAKDKNIVKKSSSGGAFTAIAQAVLKENGIVYGAVFDKTSRKVTYMSTEETDLEQIRRSKYVECRVNDSFIKIKEQLNAGKKCLFCGTPCHVAALKGFLDKEYDNLLTCDFICGGVPSAQFFEEHLLYLENKYKSKVKSVNFRPKLYGWKEHSFMVEFENGRVYKNYAYLDTYFRGFISEGVLIRDSCYSCQFRNNHYSDFILADFWGYKQVPQIKENDTGISLITVNSDKGAEFVNNFEEYMNIYEIPISYTDYNFKTKGRTCIEKKQSFLDAYKKNGFEKSAKQQYMTGCVKFRIRKCLKRILKRETL